MPKGYLLILSFFFLLIESSSTCKKSNQERGTVVKGTIIGFDQCTGDNTNNSKEGYVIKIETLPDSGNSIIVDTATAYNLPQIFKFPPFLFANYQFNYEFPSGYQDTFKFKFSYISTPANKRNYPLCTADIYLEPFNAATKGHQITITHTYEIIP